MLSIMILNCCLTKPTVVISRQSLLSFLWQVSWSVHDLMRFPTELLLQITMNSGRSIELSVPTKQIATTPKLIIDVHYGYREIIQQKPLMTIYTSICLTRDMLLM
jgi:hypothetical protein